LNQPVYEEFLKDHTKLTPQAHTPKVEEKCQIASNEGRSLSLSCFLILFTVALPALGAEIAVNVRDADFVRNGYAEIDIRLKDAAPEGAVTRLGM